MLTTVIGTRPEIIKMAQLIPLFDRHFNHDFVLSGAHFNQEMVDVFLNELSVRKPDSLLNARSSEYPALLPLIKNHLKNNDSKYVVVYGDTATTMAATLAAQKYHKKIIHIEAGLRSYDKRMAEELIRVIVDHLSDYLFTPTDLTSSFLKKESITDNVFVVGNTAVDACLSFSDEARKRSRILENLNMQKDNFVVSTIHRAENVDEPKKLMRTLQALSVLDYPVVLPMHPRIRKRIEEFGFKMPKNVVAIDPVGYFDMLQLIENAVFVATDSGGLQEEAITLGTPCLTLRETTERWETIAAGANFLVGSDPLLIEYYAKMIVDTNLKNRIKKIPNPYGNGKTSENIAAILKEKLQ